MKGHVRLMDMEERPRKAKGRLITIEGLNGSGKNTQAKLLAGALRSADSQVCMVSFPIMTATPARSLKMYLSGKFGTQPDPVNDYAASTFFEVDYYVSWKQDWGLPRGWNGCRGPSTTSNVVYQWTFVSPAAR